MEKVIQYIKDKYEPISIIVYGSYADGTNCITSDFDALVISNSNIRFHDTSFIGDLQLDIFVYPKSHFDSPYSYDNFVQLCSSKIVFDTDGYAKAIVDEVKKHFENKPFKNAQDIKADKDWCIKMLNRVRRSDTEGMYRWHLLLTESLKIFCDIKKKRYLGSKKSLSWMKKEYPEAYTIYEKALTNFDHKNLEDWVEYINELSS